MPPLVAIRSRAFRLWRAFWPLVIVLAGGLTCDSPTSIGTRRAAVAIQPVFSLDNPSSFAGLTIDQVRIYIIRPPSDTIARGAFPFAANADTIRTSLTVDINGSSEQLIAAVEMLAGTQLVFAGSQTISVQAGPVTTVPASQVALGFVGPGAQIASINMAPRDTGVSFNGTVQFRASPRDSQNTIVPQFYVGWSTSNPAHDIDANGLLTAGNSRGTFWVFARTPTGIRDSTRITVAPTANALQIAGGNGQSGSAGVALASPLLVQVRAADNLGVAGVPVTFAVTGGGGSVTPATVVTDSLGFAATTATLGPAAGANSFTASAPGLGSVTFTATATTAAQPQIIPTMPGSGSVANGRTEALSVKLRPAVSAATTVTVVSDSTQYLTVAAPGTFSIAAGDSVGTINLTGHATNAGIAVVRISAPGYGVDTVFVPVIPAFLQLPASGGVAVGSSTTLPLTLTPGAPAGGVTVTVTSSDTLVARITNPSIVVAAGATSANVTVQGVASGTVAILATAPGYLQGGTAFTVGSGGPAVLQKIQGDNQTAFTGDTTPIRPQVRVLDAGGAPVANQSVQFAVTGGGGSISGGGFALTDATGHARLSGTWTMGPVAGANALTASLPGFPGVAAVVFNATSTPPPPVIELSIFGSTVVGQARSGTLNVKLRQPAPAGGVTVTLTTRRPGLLRIGTYTSENGSTTHPAGDTLQSITVFGDSIVTGVDTVIATAPGYSPDTLAVPVSQNLISLPTTLNVPLSQTVNLPINLSVPAPAGGIVIAVSSDNPGAVTVTTPTVTIAAGSQVGNATVSGAGIGTANVTATNPNFAPDISVVSTTAALRFQQTTIFPNGSFGLPAVIELRSGAATVGAPAGGIAVTLTSLNPACATAPNTTIPAGSPSVAPVVSYGGSATLPCNTSIIASGPAGFTPDTLFVNMQPAPVISASTSPIGAGLQRNVGVSLGASNHTGRTIRVTSTNPALYLIAANDSTVGAASQDIFVPLGQSFLTYYVQAIEGTINDSARTILTDIDPAPGFVPDTVMQHVFMPVFDIIFLTSSANTRSANDPFQVRTGSSFSPTGGINQEDEIRAGGVPVTVSVINDSAAVANLVTTATGVAGADSVTTTIAVRQARSPGTVAQGGVEFRPTGAGTTTVRAHAPGYRPVGAAISQNVVVTAPTMFISNHYLGAMLQRGTSGSLGAAGVTGDTVKLKVRRAGVALLGANDSTFADSVLIPMANGSFSFSYWVQTVDTVTADSVEVIATLPGFVPDTAWVVGFRPVVDVIFLNGSGTTRAANDPFQVRIGSAFQATGGISTEDVLRFGAAPQTFSVVNDSSAYAKLVTTATGVAGADSVTVQIAQRQSRSPGSVATGGVEFRYLNGGVARVRTHGAGFRPVGSGLGQNVTITAPALFAPGTHYLGAMLQRQTSVSFGAAAIANDTLKVKLSRPGVARIGLNDSTFVDDSVMIALNPGVFSTAIWIQGVDTVTADSIFLVASMPGYTRDSSRVVITRPVVDVIFLNTNATALDPNDAFQLRIGSTFSNASTSISTEDVLRFGLSPVTVTATTSQPTVADVLSQNKTLNTASATIGPRQSRTPSSFATGGIELDYQTTGTTVITASGAGFRPVGSGLGQTVTVVAPALTIFGTQVGSGLQTQSSGNMTAAAPAGFQVKIKSSNPAIALVSPNATTPGADSIFVTVPAGQSFFSFYVQGVEGVTAAPQQAIFTASGPGFTDGTATMTVVQPAIDVIFLTNSIAAASADDDFQVRVGYANSPNNTSMQAEQEVRAGAPGPLTVSIQSTNTAAGSLTTATQTSTSPVTVTIPVGQARSTGTLRFDPVAAGITFIVPTISGYITVQQGQPGTPGFRLSVF